MDKDIGIITKLESEFDFDIIDEFVGHFEAMYYSMEMVIINLEKKEFYKNSVNELFRIFHNLKSSTSFLKLEEIRKLCIITEDKLEEARKYEGPAKAEFVDWLLLVYDQLGIWLNEIQQNKPLSLAAYIPEPPKILTEDME